MAFQQGLSGLGVASRALDVISSNVANSSTVGFKSSGTVFADTYAASMGGGVSNLQVGMGGNTLAVRQAFTQGATTATNNPLDMAIAGNGFFQIERGNQSIAYTRNGQFDLDKNGFIVTPLGERLMGYQTINTDGTASFTGATTPRALQVPPIGIGATATSGDIAFRGNLNSSSAVPTVTPFDPTDPKSYNFTTSSAFYDSLGNQYSLTLYFVKDAAPATNQWTLHAYAPDIAGTPAAPEQSPIALATSSITFDPATGSILGPSSTPAGVSSFPVPAPFKPVAGAQDVDFTIDLSSFTQRNSGSAIFEITQNGTPPGELANVSVSANGIVQGRYTNGQTRDLGQVILSTFRNPNGLASVGDNLWVETQDSGMAALAAAGDGLNGTIGSGRVEESNVDMSQELVQMIIQQRNYQANAQSIKTQDALLQTLINMR